MLRLEFEKRFQGFAGLVVLLFEHVKLSEVQIGLVECGHERDTGFELTFGFGVFSIANEKDAEIVQGIRVIWTDRDSFLG